MTNHQTYKNPKPLTGSFLSRVMDFCIFEEEARIWFFN